MQELFCVDGEKVGEKVGGGKGGGRLEWGG